MDPLAYQLTIVGLVLSMARLGDMLGRKRIYSWGFVLLGVGSVCCGLSAQLWQIIGFRVIEAVGGALVLANGRAIASALYAQEGLGRALGMMSMSFHLGYITGPSVGGLSLTSANVANAMGVAVGSVLFLRWLKFHGLADAVVPPYTEWGAAPEIFIRSFQHSWHVIATLAAIAIITSAMRGKDRRDKN